MSCLANCFNEFTFQVKYFDRIVPEVAYEYSPFICDRIPEQVEVVSSYYLIFCEYGLYEFSF